MTPPVGFDVFDRGNVAQDGLIWGVVSIVPAVLTATLHAVGQHQQAMVETYTERRADVTPTGRVATR